MTATNMCSNFGGFSYCPPLNLPPWCLIWTATLLDMCTYNWDRVWEYAGNHTESSNLRYWYRVKEHKLPTEWNLNQFLNPFLTNEMNA